MLKYLQSLLSLLSYRCPLWLFALCMLSMIFLFSRNVELEVTDKIKLTLKEDLNGGSYMDISNPNSANTWVSDEGQPLHMRQINIGAWDMDTSSSKNVAHGLPDYTKIRMLFVWIYSNGFTWVRMFNTYDSLALNGSVDGGIGGINATNISLMRKTGGAFDGPNYNDPAQNRGYINIMYEQ